MGKSLFFLVILISSCTMLTEGRKVPIVEKYKDIGYEIRNGKLLIYSKNLCKKAREFDKGSDDVVLSLFPENDPDRIIEVYGPVSEIPAGTPIKITLIRNRFRLAVDTSADARKDILKMYLQDFKPMKHFVIRLWDKAQLVVSPLGKNQERIRIKE